ncbi:hypothetical protein Bbelb_385350 [Branchiostoma belcheri]|nr:hypothetical protein Bbelb_385350 [Branchiostoma belcheri]
MQPDGVTWGEIASCAGPAAKVVQPYAHGGVTTPRLGHCRLAESAPGSHNMLGKLLLTTAVVLAAIHSTSAQGEECELDPAYRLDCGWPGITELECLERECCFDSSGAGPWCFYKVGPPPPPLTTEGVIVPGEGPYYEATTDGGTTCEGGNYNQDSGSFQLINYANNQDCTWQITVSAGKLVLLQFTQFEVEDEYACNYDSVTVYDGDSASSPELGKFCGSNLPPDIVASSNTMSVRFFSDGSVTLGGFSATFSAVDTPPEEETSAPGEEGTTTYPYETTTDAGTTCDGGNYNQDSGSFQLLNYANNQDCTWQITVSAGKLVLLQFTQFDVEDGYTCGFDSVIVYDGDFAMSPVLGTFCGSSLPPVIVASSNTMSVQFVSDDTVTATGFSATFSAVDTPPVDAGTTCDGGNYNQDSGSFQLLNYANNQDCTWQITVSAGKYVLLQFTQFDVEEEYACDYDSVIVYDGDFLSSPELGKFCGSSLPPDIVASSNTMSVRFFSDGSVIAGGFSATFSAVDTPPHDENRRIRVVYSRTHARKFQIYGHFQVCATRTLGVCGTCTAQPPPCTIWIWIVIDVSSSMSDEDFLGNTLPWLLYFSQCFDRVDVQGDSGSLSEDQTGRNGKRSGLFPNASQEKFLAEEEESGERKVPAPTAGGSEEKEKNSNLIPPLGSEMPLGVGTGNIRRLGAKCPSALAPGTSAAWERNAPLALAPGTWVKEGDGAELPPPRPKFPPGSEELGSPTVPKLGGEKSPPPPSETPFPPGFDAASFLQWISSSLGLPQASSSSRQPRDVDGAVASTSRTGVVGSGREHPGSEVEECSEEGKITFSDSDEELKAASLALRSFVSADTQHDLLRLDNATAVAYVNHVGGTRSPDLAALALEMWSWALERGLTLSATHVPGLTNTLADKCSRVFSGQELGSAVPATQQETPSAVARSDACRVAKIRRQLQGRGLSAGASDLILSAWRESTSRQYQSAWAQRPHRPVGSATLARWVKSVLGTAGVDTATFSAHSTRGASTSAAAAAGVSLHSIMKAADWSRESTFLKYYRRDNNQHTFGQAVLSTALKSA